MTGVRDEGETSTQYDVANSTTFKKDCCHKQLNTKLKLVNESLSMEVTGKPKDYNTADLTLNLKHVSKYTPSKDEYETANSVKFGSPLVGPLRFWTTVSSMFAFSLKRSYIIIENLFIHCD